MSNNKLEMKYNVPVVKSPESRDELNAKIDNAFRKTTKKIVVLYGESGSGKTASSVDYSRNRANKQQRVIFLNASGPKKIDFSYRRLAYDYLKLPRRNRKRTELIAEVNDELNDYDVLMIFDHVKRLDDLKDYLANLPTYAKVIITTTNESMRSEFGEAAFVKQELFDQDEAARFIRNRLTKPLSDGVINKLVHRLEKSPKVILPDDAEKCYSFINESGLRPDQSLNTLMSSKTNFTETILDFLIDSQPKTQTEKPNELLINYISMLDPDLIPLDLISGLYDNDKTQYEAMLNSLVSFSLVQIVEQENYIRLSRKTSQEMLDWMKRRYAKRINKIYENLVNVLDVLFTTEKITQESCLYYPSLVYLFSLDFKYKLTKKRSKDSEYNLYYKMAFFCLNYMRDPQNALDYLETGINFDNDDEFIAPKSLMGKIYLLKGKCYDNFPDYQKAINEKNRSYQIRSHIDDPRKDSKKDIIESLESLSFSFAKSNNLEKSLECDEKVLKLSQEERDSNMDSEKQDEWDRLVAKAYFNLGATYTKLKSLNKALECFKNSFEIRDYLYKTVNHPELYFSMSALASTHQEVNNVNEAEEFALMAEWMKKDLDAGLTKRRRFNKKVNFKNLSPPPPPPTMQQQPKPQTPNPILISTTNVAPSRPPSVNPEPVRFPLDRNDVGIFKRDKTFMNELIEEPINYKNDHIQAAPHIGLSDGQGYEMNEADRNYQLGLKSMNAEDYNNAVSSFKTAYEIYSKYSKEEQVAYCMEKMGVCYLKLRNYHFSYQYLTKAYEKRKQMYPNQQHPDLLISLNSLAHYYDCIGSYTNADVYREKASNIRHRIGMVKDPEYAISLNNLGVSYMKLGQYQHALTYIEQAYNIRKELYPNGVHVDLANSLYNLANIHLKMNSISMGIRYAHQLLDIQQRLNSSNISSMGVITDPSSAELADALSLLGILYYQHGDYRQSEIFNKQAYDMRCAIYTGPRGHPKIANSLYNLGLVYAKLGEMNKSTEYFNKSYEMRKANFENKNRIFDN